MYGSQPSVTPVLGILCSLLASAHFTHLIYEYTCSQSIHTLKINLKKISLLVDWFIGKHVDLLINKILDFLNLRTYNTFTYDVYRRATTYVPVHVWARDPQWASSITLQLMVVQNLSASMELINSVRAELSCPHHLNTAPSFVHQCQKLNSGTHVCNLTPSYLRCTTS